MVSKEDDDINFDKLDEQLSGAMNADERYWRENDAKLRAVHQRVGTYEEFKDIVLAAHLKPVEKNDLFKPGDFLTVQWNTAAQKVKDGEGGATETSQPPVKAFSQVPRNSMEFYKEWKKLGNNSLAKYNALIQLRGPALAQIFDMEIGNGLLGEFFQVLLEHFQVDDSDTMLDILENFPKTGKFELTLMFLNKDEKTFCKRLFEKLKDVNENKAKIESIQGKYNI